MTDFIVINNTYVDKDAITILKVPTIVNIKEILFVVPVTELTTIEGISISKHPDIKSIVHTASLDRRIFSDIPFEKFIEILSAR